MKTALRGHQRRLTTKCVVYPALDPGTERREWKKRYLLTPPGVRLVPQKRKMLIIGNLGEVCTGTSL